MRRLTCTIFLAAFFLAGCNLFNPDSSDASLSSISIPGVVLSPGFASPIFSYTAAVDADTDSISVTATPTDSGAKVDINGRAGGAGRSVEIALGYGPNQIAIVVLSESRARRAVYTVTVTRDAPSYSIGGTVSGLTGSLTLQNNGGDDLSISANGSFAFAAALDDGDNYDVTVNSQPAGQTCTVTNGAGTIDGADVSDVSVSCVDDVAAEFRVLVSVNGLVGNGVAQLNGANDVLVTTDGPFAFIAGLADGASYDVSVLTQPVGQNCVVSNGSGIVAGGNVLDVGIDCTGAGTPNGSIFDWEWVNPLPHGTGIADLATNGTTLVAVGSFGLVQTSLDGLTWTRRDSGTGHSLVAVEWTGSVFLAVSEQGSVLSSTDGSTWQALTTLPRLYVNDMTSSGSLHVMVGYDPYAAEGMIATSADGVSWSRQSINPPNNFLLFGGVAFNGNVFAAVQSPDYVHISADGVNWTTSQIDVPGTVSGLTIATDGSRFVAVDPAGLVYTSIDDGATWTRETEAITGSAFDIRWDGTRFVVPGFNEYATSSDGTTWSYYPLVVPSFAYAGATTRFNGLNIMAFSTGAIYTSPDDASWTTPFTSAYSGDLHDVIWHGGQFIAVGRDATILTSPNGATWTTRNSSPGGTRLFGITFANGQYVTVGNGTQGQILTSPDAVNWTSHTPVMGGLSLQNVAWGDGQYVAVGNSGVMTSPDGATWTAQTTGFIGDETLFDVAWNGSIWVVTGYRFDASFNLDGFTATSPDGVTWTKHAITSLFYLRDIEWDGTRFVMAGSGVIGTSSDGVNWSLLGTTSSVGTLSWSGSQFTAAGFLPDILISPDGLDWSPSRTPSGSYQGVASNGTTVVLVGYNGQILRGTP